MATDSRGFTALHNALMHDADFEVVRYLIDRKADVNAISRDGETALHFAVLMQSNRDRIQYLIDNKADIMATSKSGRTMLHYALEGNADLEVVKLLIDYKLDIHATDELGRTPLHVIFYDLSAPTMALVLSQNVDLFARDEDLNTPLHRWVRRDCTQPMEVLCDHMLAGKVPGSMEDLLLCVDGQGRFPFHYTKSLKMLELLLEQPLSKDDQVAPRVCYWILFARHANGVGESLVDTLHDRRRDDYAKRAPLRKYIASYTDLPLAIPAAAAATTTITMSSTCEHRDKRQRTINGVGVKINPRLNEFQRSIAEAFLKKWNDWSTLFQSDTASSDKEKESAQLFLPDEMKVAIMAYLTPVDIMKLPAPKRTCSE